MKYIGYFLFSLMFVLVGYVDVVKSFFLSSLDLAPEITYLIVIFYCYIAIMSVLLDVFPNLVGNRASVFKGHLTMACSVMVSLGLVGTFLGLVDMISGIGSALTSDATDFAQRMENLLSAISSSLGAMSFAFMTSILGVGISAYSMVAGNFVVTSFSDSQKEKNSTLISNDSFNADFKERLDFIEDKVNVLSLQSKEGDVTPLIIFESLTKQNLQLVESLELMIEKQSKSYEKMEKSISQQCNDRSLLANEMKVNNEHLATLSKSLNDFVMANNKSSSLLKAEVKKNNEYLESMKESTEKAFLTMNDFMSKVRRILS